MNFDYSEEQQLLADSVRRLLQKDYEFEARKKIVASKDGYSAEIWAKFAEMGLTALPLPSEYGGFGGGAVDLMGVMEAFGESLVVEPLVPTLLGALLVAKGGSAELKQALLPAVAEGRMKLAFAHSEPGSRYDLKAIKTRAGGSAVSGEKSAVLGAPMADKLVVSAQGGELFVVDAKNVKLKAFTTIDEMRAADVVLSSSQAIPLEGGAKLVEEIVDFATALACAEAAG